MRLEANEAPKTGGSIFVEGADISVDSCAFIANVAPIGAAIFLGENSGATVTNSFFQDNVATQVGGADIAALLSTISIEGSEFVGGTGPGVGAALHIDRPFSVKILHSTFSPLMDGADTVFLAGRLGGCNEHPCNPGQACSCKCTNDLHQPLGCATLTDCL